MSRISSKRIIVRGPAKGRRFEDGVRWEWPSPRNRPTAALIASFVWMDIDRLMCFEDKRSLIDQLKDRGYDITTLRITIDALPE